MRILYASEDCVYNYWPSGHDGTMASGGSSPAGLIRRATIQHFELAEKGQQSRLCLIGIILGEKGFSKVLTIYRVSNSFVCNFV